MRLEAATTQAPKATAAELGKAKIVIIVICNKYFTVFFVEEEV
jgi:hypothetical protein